MTSRVPAMGPADLREMIRVLRAAGLDREYSGLALGMGLDRLLMLIKDIPDIRLLRSADPRVAVQMLALDRYTEVWAGPGPLAQASG
jgi:phenylalanyl-tRNA synthetase alpha chain